jgi:hypothetical protein
MERCFIDKLCGQKSRKAAKHFLAARLGIWWVVITEWTEIIVAANDREQSISRVFKTMVDLIKKTRA